MSKYRTQKHGETIGIKVETTKLKSFEKDPFYFTHIIMLL